MAMTGGKLLDPTEDQLANALSLGLRIGRMLKQLCLN